MNSINALKQASHRLDIENKVSVFDIVDLVNKEGIIIYREKYGFIRFINGYDLRNETFNYVEAPLGYSFSVWQSILHINRLGFQTEHQKSFSEIEYFSWEIRPFSKLQKWVLRNIMKVNSWKA